MGRTCLIVVSQRVEALTGIAQELAHAVSLARTEKPTAAYLTMRESQGHSNNTNTSPIHPAAYFFALLSLVALMFVIERIGLIAWLERCKDNRHDKAANEYRRIHQ